MTVEKIIKRDGRLVPFDREKITFAILSAAVAVGGRNRETAEAVTDDVVAALETRKKPGEYPTVEEVQDLVEKTLIERGHAKTAKAYIVYRYEHALKRARRESLTYSSENIPYRKLWDALSWSVDVDCVYLSQLSNYVNPDRFTRLIEESESFYRNEIESAAATLRQFVDDIRMIIVAGPSSSGKTTTTKKLAELAVAKGRRLIPIEVDNYFFDIGSHPRTSLGDVDYETPQALDMELLNSHLNDLMEGREVDVPYYNFKTGRREGSHGRLRLEPRDILLIDSLHGLHEPMTAAIPAELKFKVYIETLSQIKDDDSGKFVRWADIRMMRRMVRDMQFRNYNPRQTLHHWHLVRRSELRYIISRLRDAHVVVNSYLAYELPIWKARLSDTLLSLVKELEGTVEREDARERALRVTELFERFPAWSNEELVPGDSLLREFIGGSVYTY